MLVSKSVFKLIIVLSNYQTCSFPLKLKQFCAIFISKFLWQTDLDIIDMMWFYRSQASPMLHTESVVVKMPIASGSLPIDPAAMINKYRTNVSILADTRAGKHSLCRLCSINTFNIRLVRIKNICFNPWLHKHKSWLSMQLYLTLCESIKIAMILKYCNIFL